jgi:hypothetical protein
MDDAPAWRKLLDNAHWLPAYAWQRLRRAPAGGPVHLVIAVADHFEPSIEPGAPERYAPRAEQERRLERWCRLRPRLLERWRDSDGRAWQHTFFFPAEQHDAAHLDRLADHCRAGWGEIEIHLHHGQREPDTSDNTRRVLRQFIAALSARDCLSRWDDVGPPAYAYVHGNWALANSAGGRSCGVEDEMQILSDTGCYADLTLPSAPNPAQVAKINALYECAPPLDQRAPHRRGRDLQVGRPARVFPLIVQGPLMLNFDGGRRAWRPRIENGALTGAYPPTVQRLRLWRNAAITVRGRPDWVFIKLHCHGMDPRDEETMLGDAMRRFLRELTEGARNGKEYRLHFVTAREMVNIILAACDGRDGTPADHREYRLRLAKPRTR